MKPVIDILEERISNTVEQVTGQKASAIVKVAADAKFGDYQANGVMGLAKKLKTNPRQLAEKVVEQLDLNDICGQPEIAGPGFINLRLKPEFLSKALLEINADTENHLGVSKVDKPDRVVVDFSGPNIAKQMHVGHLRSTIIGDCICRVLEFLGHNVIRQNHFGNWGTQFGRVILGLWHLCMSEKHGSLPYFQDDLEQLRNASEIKEEFKKICKKIREWHEKDWLEDSKDKNNPGDGEISFSPFIGLLENRDKDILWQEFLQVYQYVNILEDSVKGMGLKIPTRQAGLIPYESLSRHITTMLQKIDKPENKQEKDAWNLITGISLEHCQFLYDRLNVTLTMKDVRGESFYRKMLPGIVAELKEKNLAIESDGAVCVFPEGFKNKEGQPLPLIVQKSDGAHLYATTDLAAIQYRVDELKADRIIYVTDSRQGLHFDMVFAVARKADWVRDTDLAHVTFGSVQGEDGKPLKTRSGENVKLKDLLDEAVERATAVVEQKNPELSKEKKDEIAKAVGIGAVKYADYSNNRTSDYIFSFDKMLAMDGNTAPYMQYAYARIKSIERKAESKDVDIETELKGIGSLSLTEPAELDLAKHLIRYGEAIESVAADYRPNYLTSYLFELAQKFSGFYTNCPVLIAEADKRPTRLLLCDLTARTIKHGLKELLGIEVVDQM